MHAAAAGGHVSTLEWLFTGDVPRMGWSYVGSSPNASFGPWVRAVASSKWGYAPRACHASPGPCRASPPSCTTVLMTARRRTQ